MITDTHCHIFWKSFDEDRDLVLQRAREAGVERMLVVGTDLATSKAAAELCAGEPGLFPTAGIHPHDAAAADPSTRKAIEDLCRHRACVAVGETGLDYFKGYGEPEAQRSSFRWQLGLARELDKPIVVHCREAHEDVVAVIQAQPGVRGVMHCYSLTDLELAPYLDAGFYISFSGIVTYPKNDGNRRAAEAVPQDRLLVETDCPFLAPQGHRGKRNEPAFAAETLAHVAKLRGSSTEELAFATSTNAARLFGLPLPTALGS